MKQLQHKLLLIIAFIFMGNFFAAAQQTLVQGFERTAADNFAFVATPRPYNIPVENDVWTDTTAVMAAISPATGNRFWFARDIENTGGGGAFFHTLDFAPVNIGAFVSNTLSFKYFTFGYEAADSLGYIVEYNNGTTWNRANFVLLNRNTDAWTTITLNAPAGSGFIRLRLMAKQNGNDDYAGFDDVRLVSSATDGIAPLVLGASVPTPNTIRIAFNEAMNATAAATANYTGITGLATAVRNTRGDTVTLTYNTPFPNGQAQTLTVTGVQDAAGNALAAPFVFNFTFNNSTPSLIFSEIMYNPPSSDPDSLEFIEIYNAGTTAALLGGLRFSAGPLNYTFGPQSLAPAGTALLAVNKAAADRNYKKTFFEWTGGFLGNGGGDIALLNSVGTTIDRVAYDDAAPWPLEPDGNGPSLELISPTLDNNIGSNWKASTSAVPGLAGHSASPGAVVFSSVAKISFDKTTTPVAENAGPTNVVVKVDGLGDAPAVARIRVRSGATAVVTEDYVLLDSVVTFLPGAAATINVRVNIIDDNAPRNSRYLILTLAGFSNAEAGATPDHAVLISDNDTPAPAAQPGAPVQLKYVSSIKVDSVATGNVSAEISAFEPVSKRIFVSNSIQNTLEIIDLNNPARPRKIRSIAIAPYGGGINSVAVARTFVAVAVEGTPIQNNGKVVFFNNNGDFVREVPVGALPDMLIFTPDGNKLLVANEGEPNTNYSNDPEGTVSIIDMTPGAPNLTAANVTTADFRAFNADSTTLRRAGVRIFGPRATVARDVEPEYIAISDDNKTAYVILQENNALALLNLETNRITAILPLGLKDWAASNQAFDASDETAPGIFFNNWKVKGIYQPDAISFFQSGGAPYLISANEGDAREYDAITEGLRLSSTSYVLDPTAFPDAAVLKRADLLGRLNVTRIGGDRDGDGDFDEIHTLGGRSFTIWNAATGAVVWDSGDEIERITAADPVWGAQFNANNTSNTRKSRSDDKGPEPEGVTTATLEGRQYAFVSLERIGGVMLYDITNPTQPRFIQYANPRATGSAAGGDRGAEGIIFIPAAQSPSTRPLVILSNEISGTLSIYEIERTIINTEEPTENLFDQAAVFPNPTTGMLTVALPEIPAQPVRLTLFNVTGQMVAQQSGVQDAVAQFNLASQPAGVYLLHLQSGTATKTLRVLKGL